MSNITASRSSWSRWALFLFLLSWGLGYIAWFVHLSRNSRDFIAAKRIEQVCAAAQSGTVAASFGFGSNEVSRDMLASGWSIPEQDGVWSVEPNALLVLPVPQSLRNGGARLAIELMVPINKKFPAMPIQVSVSGTPLTRWAMDDGAMESIQYLDLPAGALRSQHCIVLKFHFENAYRPAKQHLHRDGRLLGMSLKRARWIETRTKGRDTSAADFR